MLFVSPDNVFSLHITCTRTHAKHKTQNGIRVNELVHCMRFISWHYELYLHLDKWIFAYDFMLSFFRFAHTFCITAFKAVTRMNFKLNLLKTVFEKPIWLVKTLKLLFFSLSKIRITVLQCYNFVLIHCLLWVNIDWLRLDFQRIHKAITQSLYLLFYFDSTFKCVVPNLCFLFHFFVFLYILIPPNRTKQINKLKQWHRFYLPDYRLAI